MADDQDEPVIVFDDGIQRLWKRRQSVAQGLADLRMLSGPDRLWRVLEERLAECHAVFEREGWKKSASEKYPFEAEPFSELWYAGEIARRCDVILESKGNPLFHLDVLRAITAAELWTEWDLRRAFAKEIRGGKKLRIRGKDGAEMTNYSANQETSRIVERMDHFISQGWNKSDAARHTIKALNLKAQPDSIVRRWNRHKTKR